MLPVQARRRAKQLKRIFSPIVFFLMAAGCVSAQKGILLEDLTWKQAQEVLRPETVVVFALGAEAKEHGPHLPLNTDMLQAEYFKEQVRRASDVVIAPTINYGFYPAFLEYPGSTSLSLDISHGMIADLCRSLAHFGPRRFYFINIGISTNLALKAASDELAGEGILLHYLDLTKKGPVEIAVAQQVRGSHADEIETSIMLYISPHSVDMKKAVKDMNDRKSGMLFTRDPSSSKGIYSPTGIWGDATLATRDKGKRIVAELTARILAGIEELRHEPVPQRSK